ncbi:hypothetical protein PARPLA_00242 [Rhodobacteraceae bacterium THAF1]|uniref:hypothetical protein n=1 Tax=Palleronia sp. THAF1 TaxID=2587842 RepID=UPI000F3B40C4|nr:hypothetical protein [Palleronia sp. THAF1]QFU10193.1 hypothetical protein FIU81_16050 [Palleronia sp. THAF1]VDC16902.1 hypothetical protein PARPLA_00242 [Rhodobacteraceae bacterium THAF1]
MIRSVLAAAAISLAAQPALALSCIVPDVARSTQAAMDSSETYRIVVGKFEFDTLSPPFDGTTLGDGEAASIPAQFNGYALTSDGFTDPTRDKVILNVTCMMQSCGGIGSGVETLAFLRSDGADPILELGPCPQWAFPTPTDAQKQTVLDCVTGDCPTD